MEFSVRGTPKATEEFFQTEVANFRKVRQLLAQNGIRVDGERLYIGGMSKGGWISATLAESYLPDIAGAYLLGAGMTPFRMGSPLRPNGKRALYIGVGNLDINYPYGVQGIEYFGNLGFEVTFDGYPGLGHTVPTGGRGGDILHALSPKFVQWWKVEQHRDDIAPLRDPVAEWFESVIAISIDESIPVSERFLAVQWAPRFPYYRFLNQQQRENIVSARQQLLREPSVAAEVE
ncbi:MAG: hypothetical protein AAF585_23855, partial [Verrucomicrobiota bacterium]